ncbi:MAG: hypothetical protein SFZ23_15380 [Planctomycetota bacterium]|nr:hypothetical protein [Planctomycetota bacterium]
MHIVTKILVVFAAVLAVFLSALTIAYSSNADRIVADYNAQVDRAVTAEASLALNQSQMAQQLGNARLEATSLADKVAAGEARLRTLEAENARLQKEKIAAEDERQVIAGKISELGETARTQASLITVFRDENSTLRDNELKYRQRELELSDRIADLSAKSEVLEAANRALQEQLAEARLAAQSGGAVTTASTTASDAFTFTGPTIVGRVDSVRQDGSTGQILVQITVGTNDQVRENMKLAVHRGDRFVGNLVVVRADQRASVARVTLLAQNEAIQANDIVRSRLN